MKCKEEVRSQLILAIVSLVALYLFIEYIGYIFLFATLVNSFTKGTKVLDFCVHTGLALDDVLGTIIYWTRRHTVSANVGVRAYEGDWLHKELASILDFFFGKNHCYCTAVQEGLI